MDEIYEALATKIFAAGNGGYQIFYEDELFDAFPDECEKNRDTLENVLKKLIKDGYVEVRYARGNAYCMKGLKKFERAKEETPLPPTAVPTQQTPLFPFKKIYLYAALSALTGGALGGLIGGLIAAAVG